jgi:SAM-dependent methyltransferase
VSAPSPQQQPATWDTVAPTYAADADQWRDFADHALATVPLAATDRVLDIATGPGTLALAAARQAATVDAVDFSPGMIAELEGRAGREGLANITAAVMDAQALGFPDAGFDAAFCLFACFFFPDRARALAEMRRVLRPGGRALIVTWSPIERRPIMKISFDAMAEAMPQFPRPQKGDLQDPDECVAEMRAAGFTGVAAHTFTASTRFESPTHYRDTIVRSAAPLAVLKQKLDQASWNALMDRFGAALAARMPADGAELAAEAIFTVGTRPA